MNDFCNWSINKKRRMKVMGLGIVSPELLIRNGDILTNNAAALF